MSDNDTERNPVPGLERGLRILSEFSRREPTLTAPELARRDTRQTDRRQAGTGKPL